MENIERRTNKAAKVKGALESTVRAIAFGAMATLGTPQDTTVAVSQSAEQQTASEGFNPAYEAEALFERLSLMSTSGQSSRYDRDLVDQDVQASIDGLAFSLDTNEPILSKARNLLTPERSKEFLSYIASHTAEGPIPSRQDGIAYLAPLAMKWISQRANAWTSAGEIAEKDRIRLYLNSHYGLEALAEALGLNPERWEN